MAHITITVDDLTPVVVEYPDALKGQLVSALAGARGYSGANDGNAQLRFVAADLMRGLASEVATYVGQKASVQAAAAASAELAPQLAQITIGGQS